MPELHAWTPEALLKLRFVSDSHISPDGTQVAFVYHWIEEFKQKDAINRPGYRSAIYVVNADGGPPKRMTYATQGRDAAPRWSPDGSKLAFLSTRDEDTFQLFVLDLDLGGEAKQLTNLAFGVAEAHWKPDSSALVCISRGHKNTEHKRVEKLRDEKIIDRLPFKFDGIGYLQPEYANLWLVEVQGQIQQLSHEEYDHSDPVWSPDGNQIAFVTVSRAELEHTRLADVYIFDPASGSSQVLTNTIGPAFHPVWSPDGTQIAYLGHDNHLGNASNEALWIVSKQGKDTRFVSGGFEHGMENSVGSDVRLGRFPQRPIWTDEGIFFVATDAAKTRLYLYRDNEIEQLSMPEDPTISGFTHAQGRTAFTGSTETQPEAIYLREADGTVKCLFDPNQELLTTFYTGQPEAFVFQTEDELELQGWVLKPHSYVEGQRYPLILYIHGGPHAAYGESFMHEFQVLAAAGIGVLYINPRGSTGYGQEFRALVRKDFGGNDYRDLMTAVDKALEWPWVDSERLGVAGGSYGGYMTNWIISHTDRFKAANTQRCLSNLMSFYGTSDIGPYFGEDEFGGIPWADSSLLIERSPILYVDRITTPLLIIHSDNDHRCPVEQAEQLYTALKVLDREVRFIRFPREGHELSRSGEPLHRISRIEYILDWFRHHLLEEELPTPDHYRRTVAGSWRAKE